MTIRIEDNEPAVLRRDAAEELPPRAEPPAALAAQEAEWLAYLDSLPPYRRTLREWVVDGLRRVWDGPPEPPLTDEEMERIMRSREAEYALPELVPPDDPGRLAWEAHLRSKGYTPAKVWNWPERKRRERTFWDRVRYRMRGW